MTARLDWLRESLAVPSDDCIEWPFARTQGYGALWFEGSVRKATHVALLLDGRQPPVHPQQTRHLCNNPPCVNPRHLAVGSYSENQMDRVGAGTSNRGERNGRHRLTWEQVRDIRARYVTGNRHRPGNGDALAAEYGIRRGHLNKIIQGIVWVEPEEAS